MRTEIERLPWPQAIKKYAPDRIVACHIQGFIGFYNHQTNRHQYDLETAWTLTIREFEEKQFGSHCECVIFTEETPAEIQAKLDAMPPMERLAHHVSQCKPKPQSIITAEGLTEYLEEYPVEKKVKFSTIARNQVAQLILVDKSTRSLLSAQELQAFNVAIESVLTKLMALEVVNPENQKLTSAILGNV